VVNSGTFGDATDASIQVIDLETASLPRKIPLPDGDSPWAIAFVSDEKAYITNFYADSVTIVDPSQGGPSAIVGSIALPEGSAPAGIVVHEGRAYTANTGLDPATFFYSPASVSVIDTSTDTLVDVDGDPSNGSDTPVLVSGLNPQDLAVDAQGNLWVVCTGDWGAVLGVVDVVDPATLSETDSFATGGSPGSIAIGGGVALVGEGASASLFVIDTVEKKVLQDSSNPVVLSTTPWSFVPAVVFDRSGAVAFAAAFTDDRVFELTVMEGTVRIRAQHALETGSGPAGLALYYE
jgi:streptogramin lyase